MRVAYYPWNLRKLINWLDAERPGYENSIVFAESIGVPLKTLQRWTVAHSTAINLEELKMLAKYRQCSLQQMVDWLEITPVHLESLMQEAAS